jgi:hypothetical protein
MSAVRDPRQRGLPSLNEAREDRRRLMTSGKARIYGGSPQFWLWTALTLVTFGIVYWKFAEGALESQKSAVMAKQRAVMQTLGPKIFPVQDEIEKWTLELAKAPASDLVASGVSLDAVSAGPGLYLRLRLPNAKDVKSLRSAAARSQRDGFTSCLFVRHEDTEGKACKSPGDCSGGLLCNDWSVCARPSQPYNLRLLYRTLRILSSDWTDELHQAGTDLAVRAFELDLAGVTQNDVPVAIEVLSRARYFTAVLDEDPAEGLPAALPHAPDERVESEEERVQRVDHMARVGIWDLATHRQVVRLRAEASGEFVPVGDRAVTDGETSAAEQRQVNSCALALAVKEAVNGPHDAADAKAPPLTPAAP